MNERASYDLWGVRLQCNFHVPWCGLRHLQSNLSDTMAKVEAMRSPVWLVVAVRRNDLLEIRAYSPPGTRPRFVSALFCCLCELEASSCECVRKVMEG